MKFGRRMVLTAGGATVALPILQSLRPRRAGAQDEEVPPFSIFFRQANGVASAQQTDEIGDEPERFWPTATGALTTATLADRALAELATFADRLLVVGGVHMVDFDYADGHARGALQGLTAAGPVVEGAGGDSEANGESIDNRIGRELNPEGRDSLFMYAGSDGGWLGGPCISYRSGNNRRSALHDPTVAYQTFMGLDSTSFADIAARQLSVNDLVREQMQSLLASPQLGSEDRRRLELHRDAIRDLENSLTCNLAEDQLRELEGIGSAYESDDGDDIWATVRVHMDLAAIAVACGYTRSVAIQVGNGNDGSSRFRNPMTGDLMENFHYISHRRLSHDSSGTVIPDSDLLHHYIDIQFAQAFLHLLQRLDAYEMPNGAKLLDCGMAVWYNDLGNGPAHSARKIPFVIGGGANGQLKQGQYIDVDGDDNHVQMLRAIAMAAGVGAGDPAYLDDFGDPGSPKGILDAVLA